jgi:signal transduction histidine kinase
MPILASLIAVALVIIILAIYFYRENTRELRTAAQRVSFVNQVSHELKTPLTNIRMYAELMEDQMPEDSSPGTRKYLQVITDESRRLSRLISNVLTFARSQREELQIHKSEKSPDAIVNSVLDLFRPALETRNFKIELDLNAEEKMMLDPDILEQILGNLINNVEKYAASGKHLRIATKRNGEYLEIVVSDKGPGIPDHQKEAIFLPFHRISHALSDGVTGTGIGLSIARNLARIHGGELSVVNTREGATFRIELK